MTFEKHNNGCHCPICVVARTMPETTNSIGARVMRGLLREWGVDKPSELPLGEVLASMAYAAGVYCGTARGDRGMLHNLIDKGYQAGGGAMGQAGSGIDIEVVRPDQLEKILKPGKGGGLT